MADKKQEKHKISYEDLGLIRSNAIKHHVDQSTQVKVSKRTLDSFERAHVSQIESLIMYLNSKGLLTMAVDMDYDLK